MRCQAGDWRHMEREAFRATVSDVESRNDRKEDSVWRERANRVAGPARNPPHLQKIHTLTAGF